MEKVTRPQRPAPAVRAGDRTRVILLNKPFNVLCQFTDPGGRATLSDYLDLPGVYAAGRLDYDSEGLVLLTDSGPVQHRIADPRAKLPKTYWVQVEGVPTPEALRRLAAGVALRDGTTRPAQVALLEAPEIWLRTPAIRERRLIPTSWLSLTITEGKNRQVRRMTAAVGLPTLRLVRHSIGPWQLDGLAPGEWREAALPAGWLKGR
jgi:23S rRNA pseudouridine2457 synthase